MTKAPGRVPLMAPASGDADYLHDVVEAGGFQAVVCGRAEELAAAIAAGYLFVVLTREALTPTVAGTLLQAWAGEPDWSHPPVVALLDSLARQPAGLRTLQRAMPWLAVVVVPRPWRRRELATAFRRQAAFRDRQLRVAATISAAEGVAQRQQALRDALEHRSKNLLSNVQSMVRLALREAGQDKDLADSIGHRLHVMVAVHDLLVRDLEGVSLRAVIDETLRVHPAVAGRIRVAGVDQSLSPHAATSLALAVHELADNAVRHGALRGAGGRVDLGWTVEDEAGEARFRLAWAEAGAGPLAPPSRKGFGCRVLEQVLPHGLRGSAALTFAPDGLRFTLEAPLRALSPQGR